MGSNKREKDHESGSGVPIKAIPAKGGGGKGNWGSNDEQINAAVSEHNNDSNDNSNRRRKRGRKNEPDSLADLNPSEQSKEKQSWDEFCQQNKNKKAQIYNKNTVKSGYKKKYKTNKYEKETDALFNGANKKKKNQRKKKKKKVLLQTEVYYQSRESGRGRGRGGYGRGSSNMRGGGYQRGGGG